MKAGPQPSPPSGQLDLFATEPSSRPPGGPLPAKSYSPKQAVILAALRKEGVVSMTLEEITALVGRDVYANAEKHTGALLGNMVRRGMLARVKPGVFRLP